MNIRQKSKLFQKTLTYIANNPLPTSKANGIQIIKMCLAFSNAGINVNLIYPKRVGQTSSFKNIFDTDFESSLTFSKFKVLDILIFRQYIPIFPLRLLLFVQWLIWAVWATILARRTGSDIYYTRSPEVAFCLSIFRMPFVLEIHETPLRSRIIYFKIIRRSKFLKLTIAITKGLKSRLIESGFPSQKVKVLHDGYDDKSFLNVPDKEFARESLKLPSNKFLIGYVGQFQTMGMEKGIPELIGAYKYLKPSVASKIVFVFVGGPMSHVKKYSKSISKIGAPAQSFLFFDFVPHNMIPTWLSGFDAVVAPFPDTPHYRHNMSPLKIFEYLAMGLPIISTRLPAIEEVLINHSNALLVRPGDPQQLAQAITQLVIDVNLRHILSKGALSSAPKYSWNARISSIMHHLKFKP